MCTANFLLQSLKKWKSYAWPGGFHVTKTQKIVSVVFALILLNTVRKSQGYIIMSLAEKNKVLLNWDWKYNNDFNLIILWAWNLPQTGLRYLERLCSLYPLASLVTQPKGTHVDSFIMATIQVLFSRITLTSETTSYSFIYLLFNQYFLSSIFPYRQLTLKFLNSLPVTAMIPTKLSKSQSSFIKDVLLQYVHRTQKMLVRWWAVIVTYHLLLTLLACIPSGWFFSLPIYYIPP